MFYKFMEIAKRVLSLSWITFCSQDWNLVHQSLWGLGWDFLKILFYLFKMWVWWSFGTLVMYEKVYIVV